MLDPNYAFTLVVILALVIIAEQRSELSKLAIKTISKIVKFFKD